MFERRLRFCDRPLQPADRPSDRARRGDFDDQRRRILDHQRRRMSTKKIRLRADELVVRAGHAPDLNAARALIMAGDVFVEGKNGAKIRVEKAGENYDATAVLALSK